MLGVWMKMECVALVMAARKVAFWGVWMLVWLAPVFLVRLLGLIRNMVWPDGWMDNCARKLRTDPQDIHAARAYSWLDK